MDYLCSTHKSLIFSIKFAKAHKNLGIPFHSLFINIFKVYIIYLLSNGLTLVSRSLINSSKMFKPQSHVVTYTALCILILKNSGSWPEKCRDKNKIKSWSLLLYNQQSFILFCLPKIGQIGLFVKQNFVTFHQY